MLFAFYNFVIFTEHNDFGLKFAGLIGSHKGETKDDNFMPGFNQFGGGPHYNDIAGTCIGGDSGSFDPVSVVLINDKKGFVKQGNDRFHQGGSYNDDAGVIQLSFGYRCTMYFAF
jgi:hypothetical protein